MTRVMVVGGGKAGLALARDLVHRGHTVTIIEPRADHVQEIVARHEELAIHLGSGTDVGDLQAAGIRACDVVVACTGSDEVNLVTAALAKYEFRVERVLARVVDPRNRWLFEPEMGIDAALDMTSMLVDRAEMILE